MTRLGLLTWSHAVRIPYNTNDNASDAILLTGFSKVLPETAADKLHGRKLRGDLLAVFANH